MLLGELYAYTAKIKDIPVEITADNLFNVSVLGLEDSDLKGLSMLRGEDLRNQLKNVFSNNYQQILIENNLNLALQMWRSIINPTVENSSIKTNLAYFQLVQNWLNNSENYDWSEILSDGSLTTEANSYAVYYGLAVLYSFSTKNYSSQSEFSLVNSNTSNQKEEIIPSLVLVVCPAVYSSLFVGLGCIFVLEQEDENLILSLKSEIDLQQLNQNYQSKQVAILLVGQSSDKEKVVKKKFPNYNVINLEWDIWFNKKVNSKGYFDELVMSTLGVRL